VLHGAELVHRCREMWCGMVLSWCTGVVSRGAEWC